MCPPLAQIEDCKQFRQWGSRTPGHPENFLTPGVEVTTGARPSPALGLQRSNTTFKPYDI